MLSYAKEGFRNTISSALSWPFNKEYTPQSLAPMELVKVPLLARLTLSNIYLLSKLLLTK
jgi:hypothetical protein